MSTGVFLRALAYVNTSLQKFKEILKLKKMYENMTNSKNNIFTNFLKKSLQNSKTEYFKNNSPFYGIFLKQNMF